MNFVLKIQHMNVKSNKELIPKKQAQQSTNVMITLLKLMVWLSLKSQNSTGIKPLLEIDFFLSDGKVEVVAVFQFPNIL